MVEIPTQYLPVDQPSHRGPTFFGQHCWHGDRRIVENLNNSPDCSFSDFSGRLFFQPCHRMGNREATSHKSKENIANHYARPRIGD
jgi:hypothetical protein